MISFTTKVNTKGKILTQKPSRLKRTTLREYHALLTTACMRIRKSAVQNAPTNFGLLRASIGYDVYGLTGEVSTNLIYSLPMEFGTKPHFPQVGALDLWVERKLGIKGSREIRRVAYAVSLGISAHGLAEHRYFRDAFALEFPHIRKDFERMGIRLRDDFSRD